MARIVEDHCVGVLATGPATMTQALDELDHLLVDSDLPERCREAAEEVFSLKAGTRDYRALYAEILASAPQETTR